LEIAYRLAQWLGRFGAVIKMQLLDLVE